MAARPGGPAHRRVVRLLLLGLDERAPLGHDGLVADHIVRVEQLGALVGVAQVAARLRALDRNFRGSNFSLVLGSSLGQRDRNKKFTTQE